MANITKINPSTFEFQTYEIQDDNLISKITLDTNLNGNNYIEFFIYDLNKNLLSSNLNYTNYRVEQVNPDDTTNIIIDPEIDIIEEGFEQGNYVAYYNFLQNQIGDQFEEKLFISEISSDRTEIRLNSNQLLSDEIIFDTTGFIEFRENSEYFVDFYLNFSDNNLVIANNIKLDNENTANPTILIKLYEPLPSNFNLKDETFIVTTINESEAFQVDYPIEPIRTQDFEIIQGPNFKISLNEEINNSSLYLSYNDIISTSITSSSNQIQNIINDSSLNISVDYTNFNNFIHFSSAKTRIENFYYKVSLLESYSGSLSNLKNITSSNQSELIFKDKITDVIKNFDRFEYFMYYNSGSSLSWPKTTSSPPYELAKTGSTAILNWYGSDIETSAYFGGRILSASNYDNENKDQLLKSIPEYLREDPDNRQYELFIDMVAQYYDNVWLYTKDITQKYNADNRLDFGVSKDLVAEAIRDFGVKLYQNNFSTKDLYTAFLGLTPEGSLFPFPEITGSTPVSTGMEFVDTLISASNDIIPLDDVNKSLYKRIYHNIPYLLKSKGTLTGLRALISSYGIPDTILKISEFGGKDKVNTNDYDLYFNNFNNTHLNVAENYISSSWEVNGRWFSPSNRPSTVELRFKSEKFPPTNLSQSLFSLYNGSILVSDLVLEYNGSGSLSGSYSSSIQDPSYQYTNLKWIPDVTAGNSASISFPFLNNDWWSVMITSGSSNGFELTAANKIYNGNDGTSIGYISSSLINTGSWTSSTKAYFATSSTHEGFSGSLQEIRYYNTILSESVFKDYVMNPLSIEGNNINSAPDQLIFRAALGSEVDTSTTSILPKITGSYSAYTQSFAANSSFYVNSGLNLKPNTETFFLDQPAVGIKNRITDKIRSESDTLPSGSTLSPFRRLSQTTEASASFTENINYLEVAVSPQNQINDDIIGQLGYFNIGDYIGDPRQRSSSAQIYPDLNNLSEEYFKKYIKQYDLVDFVRLIKFFDNSLFKMIKDFIPARTSLASGIVVKQHLLERNKYKQPSVSFTDEVLTGSIDIATISGGAAGVFNPFNGLSPSPVGTLGSGPNNRFGITQSFLETHTSFSGSITVTASSQDEFYNGEFSGSTLVISNGELNENCAEFKEIDPVGVSYGIRAYRSTNDDYFFSSFINPLNNPTDGFISTYFQDDTSPALPFPNPSS